TIHGRTRAQMYSGEADWDLIGAVKNNPRMHIPIIGNGDVNSPERARMYFDRYGVDAIMIGRGSIGRPWIFREIRHYLDTGEQLPPLDMNEHVDLIGRHLRNTIEWIGERKGILHTRRHIAVTFKGLPNFRETKIKLLQSNSLEEIEQLLSQVKEDYVGFTYSASPRNSDEQ
ncbi:MAG: tRNA-dihydrouridine synthase, partial [Spirochaetales bacterium]|nr:tRNA-dihydrouridine synthase [Spirochaetales bacterium]